MLLYHFTSHAGLASILEDGLSQGDVPTNGPESQGLNAVWLTTDSTSDGHGLGDAGVMTDEERHRIFRWKGQMPPEGSMWLNKRAVRITVKLPASDRNLKDWLPWARKRLDAAWLGQLNKSRDGARCYRMETLSENAGGRLPPASNQGLTPPLLRAPTSRMSAKGWKVTLRAAANRRSLLG